MALYYSEEPWGTVRDSLYFAHLSALLANLNKRKDAPEFKPLTFMLFRDKEVTESRKSQVVSWFRSVAVGKRKVKKVTK